MEHTGSGPVIIVNLKKIYLIKILTHTEIYGLSSGVHQSFCQSLKPWHKWHNNLNITDSLMSNISQGHISVSAYAINISVENIYRTDQPKNAKVYPNCAVILYLPPCISNVSDDFHYHVIQTHVILILYSNFQQQMVYSLLVLLLCFFLLLFSWVHIIQLLV